MESTYNAKGDALIGAASSSGSWDTSTIRWLLIIGSIAIVGGYQYMKYSNNKKEEFKAKKQLAKNKAQAMND